MFLYLAQSGGTVQLPDAIAVRDGQSDGDVEFLDEQGSVIARFRRADLLLYSMEDLREVLHLPVDGENWNCSPS